MPPSRQPRALRHRRAWGLACERIAAAWLRLHGCTVLGTRWRIAGVEVDIVALHGDVVLVVEVKGRTGRGGGVDAADLVAAPQRRRLERAALALAHRSARTGRVDLVEVRWGRWPPLRWHRGPWDRRG